jgi:transcriptional regulator with XRE-family HTH domain
MSRNFGNLIKEWRGIRRFSQLSLSVESGLSSRHISFLESGRSRPTRGSVITLARALDMPRNVVNEALLSAGFAPEYPSLALDDTQLAPAMLAINAILENHDPMPAIVIDAAWNIIGGNQGAQHLIEFLPLGVSLTGESTSLADAIINDDPNNPVILNWHEVAMWSLLRLQAEMSKLGPNSPVYETYKRLEADPRLKQSDMASFSDKGPILTTKIKAGEHVLTLLTMLAEFSTVQDVTMSERRVELFFPADDTTRQYFENL